MILADLCAGMPLVLESAWQDQEIRSISIDSRQVQPGSLFVAVPGAHRHGREYIGAALAQGAVAIVGQAEDLCAFQDAQACCLACERPQEILARLLTRFYGLDHARLRVVGITGTNGKTTVSYLLEAIFRAAGRPPGVIGTVNQRYQGQVLRCRNTTPGLVENCRLLHAMQQSGAQDVMMEVSSHGLQQGRVQGIRFSGAVFTNLTQDHLDYHASMEEYFQAKAKLFTGLSQEAYAVINGDDSYGQRLQALSPVAPLSYGFHPQNALRAVDLKMSYQGSQCELLWEGTRISIQTALIGKHNIYNILAAVGCALKAGIPQAAICQGIEDVHTVPGRLQRVPRDLGCPVFVDYAHTEDALRNVLRALRELGPKRLIVVFGCGGDRDRDKRAKMGRVASEEAEFSIVTNDNPRSEDPSKISSEIISGFLTDRFSVQLDRAEAIREAVGRAQEHDVVLIAGKGHEDYQIFADKTVPFDDVRTALEALKECQSG